MIADPYRGSACSGGDPDHRHGGRCLPLVLRALPPAPQGWRWNAGAVSGGWSCWLERVGGAGARWHVLGLPPAATVGALVAVVEAFAVGARYPVDGLP